MALEMLIEVREEGLQRGESSKTMFRHELLGGHQKPRQLLPLIYINALAASRIWSR